ncbi:MAG: hypothetical protein IJV69_01795 [Kiritimatiellae bacterium]|nr:hypothetical protein [Kiritimatiellia bacterium]
MARNGMLSVVLGAMLGVTAVYAHDDLEMKMVRFEPSVQVLALEQGGLTVQKPGKSPEAGVCYKAYPYGTQFTLDEGVKCRLRFNDLSFAVVKGPAVVKPMASDMFQKVVLDVSRGDVNLSVDQRAQAGQFTVLTPMGSFTSIQGTAKLHVGEITGGTIEDDDFAFRTLSGTAVFGGLHYKMADMTQANAFLSADAETQTASGKVFRDTRLEGTSGSVATALSMGGDKTIDFALTPGAVVKITRAKNPGSDNWVVSVLTLYADGKAKNYFCYVENRGDEYATGDLLGELLPEEEEGDGEDTEETEDEASDTSADDSMDDFGDDEMF